MNRSGVPRDAARALAALLGAGLVLVAPGPALASECSEMAYPPLCVDAQTLTWCEGGALKTVVCPASEVCAPDPMFYGGVGCVSVDETDCGDITAEGECTSANSVVWCDTTRGEVVIYACGDYLQCDHDAESEQYDCLPPNVITALPDESDELPDPSDEGAPAPDDDPMGEPPSGEDDAAPGDGGGLGDEGPRGPTPDVSPSTSSDDAGLTEETVGCQGAAPRQPWAWVPLAVAAHGILATRRRRMVTAPISG